MEAQYYLPTYLYTATIVAFLYSAKYMFSPGYGVQEAGDRKILLPLILCMAYAIFLGGRPLAGNFFGDTVNYARKYIEMKMGAITIDANSEWVWEYMMRFSREAGLTVSQFFTVVDVLYFLLTVLAVRVLTPNNVMLGVLFVLLSLMFYSFGTNGIRNGLSCQIVLLGIGFLLQSNYVVSAILFVLAFGVHRSTLLPIAAAVGSMFFVKDIKYSLYAWILAIPASLLFGGWFMGFFSGLGFDDRMTTYTDASLETGGRFRWDFLLYSAMPVIFIWYICIKRQISDNWYRVIASTYCLCNAFWILVIRMEFTNRFAYLSWFLYPIVIAYPLIMLPVWENQDMRTFYMLAAYIVFTYAMHLMWGTL